MVNYKVIVIGTSNFTDTVRVCMQNVSEKLESRDLWGESEYYHSFKM